MQKTTQRKQHGFTIIEVLIVMAIAALILLIVFLAVPALQRNSRNTQYKNAVGSILGAVNEYTANNNGALPQDLSIDPASGNILLYATPGGTAVVSGKTQAGYSADVGTTAPTDAGDFRLILNRKCNGNAIGETVNRSVIVVFNVETANDVAQQCTES